MVRNSASYPGSRSDGGWTRVGAVWVFAILAVGCTGTDTTTTPQSTPTEQRPTSPAPPSPDERAERTKPARIEGQIKVGKDPWGVAYGFGSAWVAGAREVWRIDARTDRVVAEIPLPPDVAGFPTVPDDPASGSLNSIETGLGSVWVSVAGKNLDVVRIDPQHNEVVATIEGGPAPQRPAPIAVGHGAVWAVNFAEGAVSRIDAVDNLMTDSIPISKGPLAGVSEPSGVAVTSDAVWVMNHAFAELVHIDPKTRKVVGKILAEASGRVDAGEGSVWVTSAGGDTVDQVDPKKEKVVATHSRCRATGDLSVGGGFVWVSEDAGICRIDVQSGEASRLSFNFPTTSVAYGAGAVWVTSLDEQRVVRLRPLE